MATVAKFVNILWGQVRDRKTFKVAQERDDSNDGNADTFEDAEVTDHRDARWVEICLILCPTALLDSSR